MRLVLEHVGVGCNRVVGAVSWAHPNGLVAYGAHHAVVVYDPEEKRAVGTLLGHSGIVNCVAWVPASHFLPLGAAGGAGDAGPAVLASGAADNTVRLWLWAPPSAPEPWQLLATLKGHTTPVTSLTTFSLAPGRLLLVSNAGDGDVLVWECGALRPEEAGADAWRLWQRIHIGFQMQDCAALARLPADPDWLVLALGGVDSHVRLYTCPPGGKFSEACRLSGHQDWIRGLAFTQVGEGGRLLLASASQDKCVRVWAIQLEGEAAAAGAQSSGSHSEQLLDAAALTQLIARYAPRPRLATPAHSYSATLEALLVGHEDWVHSVAWQPAAADGGAESRGGSPAAEPCLLSASMDRSMMLWRPDRATGLWMSCETVGDAGPNHLGYYTGVFNSDGRGILAHGFTGALHLWRREGDAWVPKHAAGGHFAPIVDACWGAGDACLLTVSADQTARLTGRLHTGLWCEIARPQVHGHDFSCGAFIPPLSSAPGAAARYMYASGSEEKVIRVFEAALAFHDTLAKARGEAGAVGAAAEGPSRAPLGASLPALGLSNKAVYAGAASAAANGSTANGGDTAGSEYTEGPDLAPSAAPSSVAGPPLEEHLAQNTLWPEVRKLYGHGNEVYCLAADPLGRYLASACRAQSAGAAAIWVWDAADKWVGLGPPLAAHSLTVTQLAFSPDGRWLASASRDRTCALFERCEGASPPFRRVSQLKAHSRIIWALGWSPDSCLLATGSRDNTVKLWLPPGQGPEQQQQQGEASSCGEPTLLGTVPLGDAVRAVAFAPSGPEDFTPSGAAWAASGGRCYQLAVGLEGGSLHLLELHCSEGGGLVGQAEVWRSAPHCQHAAAVRRLCWRRVGGAGGGEAGQLRPLQLASVGEDHAVRIYSLLSSL